MRHETDKTNGSFSHVATKQKVFSLTTYLQSSVRNEKLGLLVQIVGGNVPLKSLKYKNFPLLGNLSLDLKLCFLFTIYCCYRKIKI